MRCRASSLTQPAPLTHLLGSVWAAALCSATPVRGLCASWAAVDPLQQPPDSQMLFPDGQHRQTGAGGLQGAHAEMGSSTGGAKVWVRGAFTPGEHGVHEKLAWQCSKLTTWVWVHLGCGKEISSAKTSRNFYLFVKVTQLFPLCWLMFAALQTWHSKGS